jgi:hypothetical protein
MDSAESVWMDSAEFLKDSVWFVNFIKTNLI